MRVFIQWAKSTAQDWFAVDIRRTVDVRNLPKRPVPGPSSQVNTQPGYICSLNCQGIEFSGYDHIAIEPVSGGGLKITGWQDDTEDFGDTRWATEWTLLEPAPDPAIGGKINTRQTRRVWASPDMADFFKGDAMPWEEFVAPPSNMTFHGIWLPDSLFNEHRQVRTLHGWREWVA